MSTDVAPAHSAARALRGGQHVLFALLWTIGASQTWADGAVEVSDAAWASSHDGQ